MFILGPLLFCHVLYLLGESHCDIKVLHYTFRQRDIDMEVRTLIILSEKNLQSSLIEQQLTLIKDTRIEICNSEELTILASKEVVDLVLVEYQYYEHLLESDHLPDFDLLDLGLLIHNVPDGKLDELFPRWLLLKGVLFSYSSVDHLVKSVICILNGGLWLPRHCLEKIINLYREPGTHNLTCYSKLTNRERQILELISHKKSNLEISKQLFLSESTVKTHIYKIYKKLNIHRRQEAIKLVKLSHSSARF